MKQAAIAIRRLLAESNVESGQTPAIQCWVMLQGMPQAISGSLSETSDGGLRMLSPGGTGAALVEQFFDYSDVIVVAVQRAVTVDGPRIISS